ncbi:hypothetical protein CTI12_AA440890 [Artemisia annua]|uniref:Uncharacterized protein n=1 Tax=Artemisia annua TaxID=35608 RepID=A0A2U1LY86_ARTAN|nr:hypothetical protein CTI12_AA440890 [Artemisia annua]
MTLVQRLTGPSAQSPIMGSSYSAFQDDGGAVSPAARFASIEKAVKSPEGRRQQQPSQSQQQSSTDFATAVEGVEMSYFPSILSPAPGSLPPIPPNFFSPLGNDFFHDLSPALHNSSGRNFPYMEVYLTCKL